MRSSVGAALVGAGIFASRVAGFVREATFAWALGSSDAADAFKAALRIPNFLQNLFGEGVLAASFIPAYAKLSRDDPAAAARLAGVVLSLLSLVGAAFVLAGVLAAPLLVDLLAPGFSGEKRDETVALVRILFPGTGLLVASAWCLGVLNSHRLFFVSYAAPVLWNAAIIAALLGFSGRTSGYALATWVAVGAVVGSALQLVVQAWFVVPLVRGMRPSLDLETPGARGVLRTFVPIVIARGVVQISAFVEEVLASLLPKGSIANIAYAQIIYTLPVSLFGMAVSAAELPEMAREARDPSALADRLRAGGMRIAFFVLPSAAAFLALGDVVAATLFQRGAFDVDSTLRVWGILAGAAFGVLASTQSRLVSSVYYAIEDTRSPLRAAIARVVVGTVAGAGFAFLGPDLLGVEEHWGAAGLALGSSVGAVVELLLLRRMLSRRMTVPGVPAAFLGKLVVAALAAAGIALVCKAFVWPLEVPVLLRGVVVLGAYGAVYFAVTAGLGVEHARATIRAVLRRLGLAR